MDRLAEQAEAAVSLLPEHEIHGRVKKVLGLLVEIAGFGEELSIGSRVDLRPLHHKPISCEVVGFREGHALLMPWSSAWSANGEGKCRNSSRTISGPRALSARSSSLRPATNPR